MVRVRVRVRVRVGAFWRERCKVKGAKKGSRCFWVGVSASCFSCQNDQRLIFK